MVRQRVLGPLWSTALVLLSWVSLAAAQAPPPAVNSYGFYEATDPVVADVRSPDMMTAFRGLARLVAGATRVCRSSVFKCNITDPVERSYLLRLTGVGPASPPGTARRLMSRVDDSEAQSGAVSREEFDALKKKLTDAVASIAKQQRDIKSLNQTVALQKVMLTVASVRSQLHQRDFSNVNFSMQELEESVARHNASLQLVMQQLHIIQNISSALGTQAGAMQSLNAAYSSGQANLSASANLNSLSEIVAAVRAAAESSTNPALMAHINAIDARLTAQQAMQAQITSLLAHNAQIKTMQCGVIDSIADAIEAVVNICAANATRMGSNVSVCEWYSTGCIKYLLARMKALLLAQMINIRRDLRSQFFTKLNASSSYGRSIHEDVDFEAFLPNATVVDYVGSLRRVLNSTDFLTASDADDIIELFLCIRQSVYDFLGSLCRCYVLSDQERAASPVCRCSFGRYFIPTTKMCDACPVGTFSASTGFATSCSSCPAGSFQPARGQSSCVKCPLGSFSRAEGATSASTCSPCPFGSSSFPGSSSCSPCAVGEVYTESSRTCSRCSPGTFVANVSHCSQCPAGQFSGAGARQCSPCAVGHFSTPGAAGCSPCPAGSIAAAPSATACTSCSWGEFSAAAASACTRCPAGTSAGARGQARCSECRPGEFAPTDGANFCRKCPPGTYSSVWGATSCAGCPAGTSTPEIGGASVEACMPCLEGTFSSRAGMSACSACASDMFMNGTGASACLSCPTDSFSTQATASRSCTAERIIAADASNSRIVFLRIDGSFISEYKGGGPNLLQTPVGVVATGQRVVIIDSAQSRLTFLTPNGTLVRVASLPAQSQGLQMTYTLPSREMGIAVDGSGMLAVADGRSRVVFCRDDGFCQNSVSNDTLPLLKRPVAVAFGEGEMYILDAEGNYVLVLVHDGASYAYSHVVNAFAQGGFNTPLGIAAVRNKTIVVCDTGNNRVVFLPSVRTSNFIAVVGQNVGAGVGQFNGPAGAARLSDGTVVVSDSGNQRLVFLSPTGEWLREVAGSNKLTTLKGAYGLSAVPLVSSASVGQGPNSVSGGKTGAGGNPVVVAGGGSGGGSGKGGQGKSVTAPLGDAPISGGSTIAGKGVMQPSTRK